MRTGFIYTIEGAEKILDGNQIVSGDTIKSDKAVTLYKAKSKANKMLLAKNVFSVWIHKYSVDELDGDPISQWVRYEDTTWNQNNGW